MGENKTDFSAALEAVLAQARGEEHVEVEQLVAYRHGRLPAEEADAVQDHLAACRECADLLLELEGFEEEAAEPKDRGVVEFETEVAWRGLRPRLDARPAVAEPRTAPREKPRAPWLAWGLAASFLLAALGLAAWVAGLRSELRGLREPQLNLPIVSLVAPGFARGEGEEGVVRGGGERFVVILNPPATPRDVVHGVEIRDAQGSLVWSGEGLQPTGLGNFHLELSRRLLPPGKYRIRLYANEATIAEFELEVTP